MGSLKNTDTSGGTRFSEGKGPLVGAPLFSLYPDELWALFAMWALDPRDHFKARELIYALRDEMLDVLDQTPAQAVGMVARIGAEKYSLLDWVEGQLASTLVNSCGRHLEKYFLGYDTDEETGQPHIAMALWNVLCWQSLEFLGEGDRLDDYSHLRGITTAEKQKAGCCGIGCLECPLKEAQP